MVMSGRSWELHRAPENGLWKVFLGRGRAAAAEQTGAFGSSPPQTQELTGTPLCANENHGSNHSAYNRACQRELRVCISYYCEHFLCAVQFANDRLSSPSCFMVKNPEGQTYLRSHSLQAGLQPPPPGAASLGLGFD